MIRKGLSEILVMFIKIVYNTILKIYYHFVKGSEFCMEKRKFSDSFRDEGKIRVFTIPNVMSMFRIALIPVFVCLYLFERDMSAFAILVLSGLTDVVDGFIARRFNMVSAVGKALDPISDKLTQAAMLYCLLKRVDAMWIPFLLMIFKEIFSGVAALIAIKNTGEVHGADWHGKVTTLSLYGMMSLHILWPSMPPVLSNILIGICVILMLNSLVLYSLRNIGMAIKGRRITI